MIHVAVDTLSIMLVERNVSATAKDVCKDGCEHQRADLRPQNGGNCLIPQSAGESDRITSPLSYQTNHGPATHELGFALTHESVVVPAISSLPCHRNATRASSKLSFAEMCCH